MEITVYQHGKEAVFQAAAEQLSQQTSDADRAGVRETGDIHLAIARAHLLRSRMFVSMLARIWHAIAGKAEDVPQARASRPQP